MASACVMSIAAPATASRAARQYYCTVTFHRAGRYGFAIIFNGRDQAVLRKGCQTFVAGDPADYSAKWGLHRPAGWVPSAGYVSNALQMTALLIAPASVKDLVFRALNKGVFTSRGWTLVKRF